MSQEKNHLLPFLELKRLVNELVDLRPDISFRYRLIGEMWQSNFLTILQVTEKGAVLMDQGSRRLFIIQDLTSIMQFELDQAFRLFTPHNHYTVEPALVY